MKEISTTSFIFSLFEKSVTSITVQSSTFSNLRLGIYVFLTCISISLMAQDGPGGVDTKDGTGDLVMWFIADSAAINGSGEVTAWQNEVAITDNGLVELGTGVRPAKVSGGLNGHAEISFSDQIDALISSGANLNASTFPTNEATTFVVTRHDNASQQSSVYTTATASNSGIGTNRFTSHLPWNNIAYYDLGNCCDTGDSRIQITYDAEWVGSYGIYTYQRDLTDGMEVWRDNVSIAGPSGTPASSYTSHGSHRFYIGHSSSDNFQGDIAEILVFQGAINDAERTIVNNYLAAKYNLDITDDFYLFQTSHGVDVIGIGQDGTDTRLEAKSANILTIKDASSIDTDGDYVFAGHDNADASTWTTNEQINGDSNLERIAREWRFDASGNPGTVTLSIDATDLPAFNTDFGFYTLWIDNDGDFTSGATQYPLTQNGAEFEATGITVTDGMFVTIAAYRPEINFTQTAFSGLETISPATFEINIDYAVDASITVDYTVSGTCTEDLPAAGTFTISAGNTTTTLAQTITSGDGFESDETIILTLTGGSQSVGTLGTSSVSTYTVNDDGASAANTIQYDAPYSYGFVKRITVDKDMVSGSGDLTDFPLMIRLDGADLTEIEGDGIRADAFDIRFTYGNSVEWLEHQIEVYDAGNEYIAWVKVPILSATADTELDVYYGNALATTDPSVNTVFDGPSYEGVWHLGDATDGSSNGHSGTVNGGATHAAGYIGDALSLDGTNDDLAVANISSLVFGPTESMTMSIWYKGTDATGDFMSMMNQADGAKGYSIRYFGGDLSYLLGENYLAGPNIGVRANATENVNDDAWHYITVTYDGSVDANGVTIYKDGDASAFGSISDNSLLSGSDTDPGTDFTIGSRTNGAGKNQFLSGLVDEARIARSALSADWIKTEYNNMTDAGVLITAAASTATSGFRIAESTDSLNLTIALANVDANDVDIDYAVTSGTASSGADYTLAAGTATITAGNLSAVVTVDLTDDAVDEVDETFTVSLSNPSSISNVSLGTNNAIEITLLDDDDGPTISVSDTLLYVNEGSTTNEWSVDLTAASGQAVTVDYTITAISATSGADYIHNDGTLTIPADSTSASVSFNIIDDEVIESGETFAIELSNPMNALLDVTYDSITVTINDNDNFGIDGPGGVGDADGTGTLVMWMIADSATVSGSNVTAWENEVGISALDMAPPGTSPTLVTNAKNGHAEISFANVNDVLSTTERLSTAYFPYNEASTFIVVRHDNRTQQSNTYGTSTTLGGGLATNRFSAHNPWSEQVYYDIGNCCGTDGRSQFVYDLAWEGNYTLFSYVASATDGKTVRGNATQKDFDAGTDTFQDHSDYYFNLGQTQSTNFQGDILEYVMFTSPLNTAQVIIMENYLAAKYDLALDQNDYYSFKTTHSTEVVGIGREDATNFHSAAQSNLLTISNASDLDDVEYVIVGHDNLDISAWTTTDVPADLSNIQRVEREFRVDVTGSPGTISIAIDSDQLPTLPADYTEYVLLTDADGVFSDGATTYSMTLVDGEYIANNVAVSQGTYFTIATHRRTIEFVGSAIQDFENVNNTISLSLSLASGSDISIPYTITGTATNGADYTIAASGSFTINAGNTIEVIDLGILDEADEESDETIIVTLGAAPSGTILGTDVVFTYTINDDDIIRSINFDHFKYSKEVTINGSEVTGTHTDFPVMISFTDNDLRTVGNAGFVENDNGYDIAFYDSLNASWLDHQLEYYDATTGEAVIWIRVPALSAGTDVDLTMFYGNSGIVFDQSSTDTWKSTYQGVWHMGNDNYDDGTSNGSNGVDQGADDAAGIIGRGAFFNGTSSVKVTDVSNLSFGVSDSYTISAWYRGTDSEKTIAGLVDDNSSSGQGYDLYISSSNYLIGWQGNDAGDKNYIRGSAGGAINDDNWYHVVVTYDGTSGIAYRNGANAMGSQNGTLTGTLSPNVSFTIGSRSSGAALARAIVGTIDEVRVLNEVLSPDWIATEYENQSSPGTFFTINPTQNTNESLTLAEDIDEVTVTVRVDPVDDSQSTTFNFGDVGSGTAIITEDFTLTPAVVTIPAGDQLGTFTFNVINDLADEQDETIALNINTPSSNTKLGTVSQQTYTVTDDDDLPTIGFVDVISVANEGSSLVAVTLELSVASGNDVSVDYAVTGGGATSGTDFIALAGTATITAGDLTTTISFQPIDDAIIESPETVELTISNPTNGTLKPSFDVHTVTIADNDDLGFEGPGGVGDVENALGENLLKLWLIADSVTFSGGNVTSWDNIVQNVSIDYDMVPVGTAPNVVDAAINGHKEISFNNVSDALVSEGTLSAASFPGNEMSFFIVTETDNLTQDSYAYATGNSENGAVDANSISASIPNGSGNVEFDLDGDNFSTTYQTGWAGSHSIFTHIVSSDTFLVYRNNGILVNRDDADPSFTGHTAYNFYLGKNGAADNFQGDIAEVVMFSRDVNIAQSNIINNYLAAKYNLNITNDIYNFEISHGVEVAGIGQYDTDNQHVAARAGIVTISNANDLDDGEYVLFGHDNGDISTWSSSEIPSAGISRTAREWRFDNTGAPGTISIAINSDLLPALPNGNEDYIIMQDADGDFTSGATVINTVLVDGQYKASDLTIASGDYVTFGIATRTISFSPATLSGSETVAANATIQLSLESSSNITLDYDITDGTATGSSTDYSLASTGTVTFIAGQTSINLALGIINDSDIEGDETIEITLSNPPSGVSLTDSVFTYTINDDDNSRNVQFNATSSSAAESVSAVSLQVDLNTADAMNDTKVYYSITGGTAESTPSPDYTFTADTLTIAATQTTGTIDFTILDDVLSEATETIIVSLSSPINANLGANVTHTYSITDNDGSVTVEFQDDATTIDEGGSIAELVVELSATSGQDVEVDYTVADVTATGSGVDYSLADGTLTIPAGNQLGTINVALTDDGIEESAETLTVTLSGEVGATLGTETVHTVTISDNDAEFGYYGPGGVGDLESNMLWLDATAINGKGVTNATDGANVSTWVDRSGNGFDFTAIGAAPTFDIDALNLKNTVIISSSNQGFQAPSGFSNALSNYSFVSVMSQSGGDYLVETNTTATSEFRLSQGANGLYAINDTDYLPSQSTNTDVTTWIFNSENSPTSAEVFRNGTALLSDDNYEVMSIDNNFALGSRNSDQTQATSDFAGNISEFIVYKNVLNDAQRVIVENYLANKYDLTIANDFYAYEGTYGGDIVGIGQTNNENHLQSMSDSLMMISGASDLQNDEYVFAGHDNGDDLTWTTSEAPSGGSNVRRLAREWRTDITGAPGTIIIKIDTTQLPTPPAGYDQYVVYTDEDGDFRSGATTYQVEYSSVFGFHVTNEVTINDGTFITIGVGQPVVEFSVAVADGDENVTNPTIEVGLNFTLGEEATVNYAATGGSATGGNVDYLLASGTLTIAPGQSAANISLGIIDDTDEEGDETVEITLTTPSDNVALGSSTVFTYTIHDNDNSESRTIDFATAGPGSGDEATPSVTSVSVNLNVPDDDVATTVDLVVVSSGANAADETDDFILSTSTISFPADNTTVAQTFDITVVDDAIFEGTEQVTIQLTNPTNANLGTITEYTLDITDNDTQPVAGFTVASSFTSESAGTASMEVSLDAISVNDVTIDYTVTASATAGTDYTLSNGSVLILAGSMSEDIQAIIVDDLLTEAAESVTVTLTGGTNATVGGTTVHVLTILDNDQSGSTGPGGVGDATNNLLWLRGDNFVVGTWSDISGNSNDFTGAGPSVGGTGINSQGTVEFSGAQSMSLATALNGSVSDYDIFFVTDSDVATNQILFDDADGIIFGVENSNGGFQDADVSWKGDEIATGTGSPSIIQYNLESGSGLAAISLNGTEDTPTVPFDYTATSIGGASTLGALSGGGSGFDGEMGEVLVYSNSLNDAQRIIVNNYLSTRYNITIINDQFAFDDGTASNDYFYNLIGIGQEDTDNIHVSATSQDFLTISNPNNLGDGEYLMIANDGADMASWTFTGAPANGSTRKLAREWRVDKTGDVGTITFQVDTTSLPTPPSNGLTWALIVTSDGDFTDIDTTYPLTSVSGDIVGVDGLNFADGDYFTLALVQYQSTGVSSDFSNPLAWTTGVVPTAGTDVQIVDGHSLFLTADVVVGSMTLEGTGELDLAGFTLEFSGDCIILNGTGTVDVSTAGSTIGYANPNVTEQCVTGMIYNNIYTDGPSGSTKYLTGDITVQGDLNLQSSGGAGATFDSRDFGTTDDYDMTIQGDWISEISFLPRTGSVTFNGTAGQTINTSGGETYNNLIVNKVGTTTMADSTITLASGITTGGTLTMTSGFVDLGAFDATISSGSSIVGGNAMSYFIADDVGVLRHAITALSTAYMFPIGDDDEYAPFTFTLNAGTLSSSSVTINMRDAKHTNIVEPDFITRYWSLNNENITGTLDYSVSYIYDDSDVVGSESDLLVRKFSGAGNTLGGTVNNALNTLAETGFDSFSDFTGESDPALLPVTLLSFEGEPTDKGVSLTWKTATELNNSYFEVLRSVDGESFASVGRVDGNGNSVTEKDYSLLDKNAAFGLNYYVLKQVDFDGSERAISTIAVQNNYLGIGMTATVYPNPARDQDFKIRILSGDKLAPISIKIVDLTGQIFYRDEISGSANFDGKIQTEKDMVEGVYFLIVKQGNTVSKRRIIMVK